MATHIENVRGVEIILDDSEAGISEGFSLYFVKGYFIVYRKDIGQKYLHRYLMQKWGFDIDGRVVDHINRNPLDNRRENLRVCNAHENRRNSCGQRNGVSTFKGVTRSPKKNKTSPWMARIMHQGERIFLGIFETEEAAARAYDVAARRYYGEFAFVNFADHSALAIPR